MNIEILSVSVNTVPTAKGSYQVAEVAYKDLDSGKVNGKKVMSFGDKKVFNQISNAKTGDKFSIGSEKDNNGYWQWTAIKEYVGEVAGATTKTNQAPRSNYETPEERVIKQRIITNLSVINSAIATLKTDKAPANPDDVLKVAATYRDWAYDVYYDKKEPGSFNDFESDIPE